MKFNKAKLSFNSYAEIGQSNPLRWQMYYKEADGSFTPLSGAFKCKDFFNEVVSKYQGNKTVVYSFNAGQMELNEEGVYCRVFDKDNAKLAKAFLKNFEKLGSINQWMPVKLKEIEKDKQYMLFIPKYYFSNTYLIGLLTYLIRVCNVDTEITDWTKHPTKTIDNPLQKYHDGAIQRGFLAPFGDKSFWWYQQTKHTKLSGPSLSGTGMDVYNVHNNGPFSWWNNFEIEFGADMVKQAVLLMEETN